jgi:putative tryptophan/tyrosine transport system substrate-binding protein
MASTNNCLAQNSKRLDYQRTYVAVHADPVGLGHVAGLARPGGNVTGTSMLLTELAAKGLEMLSEALPQTRRIGVLWNPTTPSHSRALPAVETAGEKLALELRMVSARGLEDFDSAFASMVQERASGSTRHRPGMAV